MESAQNTNDTIKTTEGSEVEMEEPRSPYELMSDAYLIACDFLHFVRKGIKEGGHFEWYQNQLDEANKVQQQNQEQQQQQQLESDENSEQPTNESKSAEHNADNSQSRIQHITLKSPASHFFENKTAAFDITETFDSSFDSSKKCCKNQKEAHQCEQANCGETNAQFYNLVSPTPFNGHFSGQHSNRGDNLSDSFDTSLTSPDRPSWRKQPEPRTASPTKEAAPPEIDSITNNPHNTSSLTMKSDVKDYIGELKHDRPVDYPGAFYAVGIAPPGARSQETAYTTLVLSNDASSTDTYTRSRFGQHSGGDEETVVFKPKTPSKHIDEFSTNLFNRTSDDVDFNFASNTSAKWTPPSKLVDQDSLNTFESQYEAMKQHDDSLSAHYSAPQDTRRSQRSPRPHSHSTTTRSVNYAGFSTSARPRTDVLYPSGGEPETACYTPKPFGAYGFEPQKLSLTNDAPVTHEPRYEPFVPKASPRWQADTSYDLYKNESYYREPVQQEVFHVDDQEPLTTSYSQNIGTTNLNSYAASNYSKPAMPETVYFNTITAAIEKDKQGEFGRTLHTNRSDAYNTISSNQTHFESHPVHQNETSAHYDGSTMGINSSVGKFDPWETNQEKLPAWENFKDTTTSVKAIHRVWPPPSNASGAAYEPEVIVPRSDPKDHAVYTNEDYLKQLEGFEDEISRTSSRFGKQSQNYSFGAVKPLSPRLQRSPSPLNLSNFKSNSAYMYSSTGSQQPFSSLYNDKSSSTQQRYGSSSALGYGYSNEYIDHKADSATSTPISFSLFRVDGRTKDLSQLKVNRPRSLCRSSAATIQTNSRFLL